MPTNPNTIFDLDSQEGKLWESALKDFYALPDTDEAEDVKDGLVTRACVLELRMLETEPNTLAGALAQVEQLCRWEKDGVVTGSMEAIEPRWCAR